MKPQIFAAIFMLPAFTHAESWVVESEQSYVRFSSAYEDEKFTGEFKQFEAKIAFDTNHTEAIAIETNIDMTSATTDNQERDETLFSEEFFWADKFKQALFRTTNCRLAIRPHHFACDAILKIRDQELPLQFPFTWKQVGDSAELIASVPVKRLAYGVGTGDWADIALIPDEVKVDIHLTLRKTATP